MAGRSLGGNQYCPISRTLDVVGDRWSLLILRDMIVGTTRYNDLARGLPGLSRSLLTKRLRHLQRAGIVEWSRGRYLLTDAGRSLERVVFALAEWGAQWMFGEPTEEELDAELLVWWMHQRIDTDLPPGRRFVLEFIFADDPRRFWILIERGESSVCLSDPGFGVDVTLHTDVASLYEVWLGRVALHAAVRSGRVVLDGSATDTRRLGNVLQYSPVAPLVVAAAR